jgi:hypothetical protein
MLLFARGRITFSVLAVVETPFFGMPQNARAASCNISLQAAAVSISSSGMPQRSTWLSRAPFLISSFVRVF